MAEGCLPGQAGMLGGGLGLSQTELRPTDPCVETGTQTWALQGELSGMFLRPLPWGGTGEASGGDKVGQESAQLLQG